MIDIKKSEEEKLEEMLYERIPIDLWYKYGFHIKNKKATLNFDSVRLPIVKRKFA